MLPRGKASGIARVRRRQAIGSQTNLGTQQPGITQDMASRAKMIDLWFADWSIVLIAIQ